MLRVLHVVDQFGFNSGVSSVVMNYYTHMDPRRVRFDFMTHTETPPSVREVLERAGGKLYPLLPPSGAGIWAYLSELDRFFGGADPYIAVHGHLPNGAVFYLGAARRHGIPNRIVHSHNTRAAETPWKAARNYFLIKAGLRQANHYFSCSRAAGRFLFGEKAVSSGRVRVLPNAVSVDRFAYAPEKRKLLREALGLEDKAVFGHVGRMCRQKNHAFLLELFEEIYRLNPDARLILLGDGELRPFLERRAASSPAKDAIRFLGVKENAADYYQAMDVFLLPSLFEGLPVVGIEAQTAGLPCVFSKTISPDAAVTDQVEFLSLNDPTALWAKAALKRLGSKGRDAADQIRCTEYDINIAAERLTEFYESLAEVKRK